MPTAQIEEVVVHVAGPVEREKVGAVVVERQRCLRCDGLLRDGREHLAWWLLGQRIGWSSDGRLRLVERARLGEGEVPCLNPRT